MNIFKLFLFLLISPLVFTSCETSQTPVDELSSLLEKIDNNSENYSEEDWNNITNEFTEIEEELSKYEYTDEAKQNYRNGYGTKNIHSSAGDFEIKVLRDRNGEFDPVIVEKGNNDISDIEQKII